ncbi:MAG: Asp-tRNA(Asn)/Glu-tRNA(Gln) amidotransferase subunit GatB [Pseudomonadales bacterium]|nr:Asp-tRNA(Asn)/Glu-tRNA(Gln) amidotransferase subunit GatB [Pseudomonadales bacterium]
MTEWEAVIGLEVHVQLATRSKIFSRAATTFGEYPNSNANAVDIALPGVLPVLNEEAVRMAIKFGLAIDAEIASSCRFDRKNYFYPDLPKGYQISQLDQPIVGRGTLPIFLGDGSIREIGITRAHLEEDAGKSIHTAYDGLTGIDLNRAGTPLLEIVSEPELHSAADAAAYFRELHGLVTTLEICDGNLNEGSMRCDANISIRPKGAVILGERTEIKNVNSFRFVERALMYEIDRQISVLESGGKVVLETRLYDSERDETRSMRSKESSDDYRYFPDPDLLPVEIPDELIESVRVTMPELPTAKRNRYIHELGLTDYEAGRLIEDPLGARYFDAVAELSVDAKLAANWILGDVAAALNRDEISFVNVPIAPDQLGTLLKRIHDETITGKIAKSIFELLWTKGGSVDGIIESQGLRQLDNTRELEGVVSQIISDFPDQVGQFREGKEKILGFFVGQVMKATNGKANPKQVNEILRRELRA